MDFYDIEAELYDLFYFDFKEDVDLYMKYVDNCESVLEFMCGTGRILYYLSHGNMWGVDLNEKMLSQARKNLQGKNVKLLRGDVREVTLDNEFCLIIIGLNSLIMFPQEERIKILKNAYRHAKRGGRIIVDVFNPFEMVEGIVHHGDTIFKGDKIYSRFFVPVRNDEHWKLIYFYDMVEGEILKRKVATMDIYPIEKEELEMEMKEAGFDVETVYGDYELGDFDEYSERIIIVGVKR